MVTFLLPVLVQLLFALVVEVGGFLLQRPFEFLVAVAEQAGAFAKLM